MSMGETQGDGDMGGWRHWEHGGMGGQGDSYPHGGKDVAVGFLWG